MGRPNLFARMQVKCFAGNLVVDVGKKIFIRRDTESKRSTFPFDLKHTAGVNVSKGAAEVKLDGNIDELLADMTGASELHAGDLQTKTTEISTTGAADAEIAVSETLKVAITGAGKVSYSGSPKTIEKHISGAGSIHHRD